MKSLISQTRSLIDRELKSQENYKITVFTFESPMWALRPDSLRENLKFITFQ